MAGYANMALPTSDSSMNSTRLGGTVFVFDLDGAAMEASLRIIERRKHDGIPTQRSIIRISSIFISNFIPPVYCLVFVHNNPAGTGPNAVPVVYGQYPWRP